MARRRVRLIFGKDLVTEPVIYHLGKNYDVVTNIRRADVTREEGWVVLEMTGDPDELDRGVSYLESRGVRVEPVEGDVVE
jgi:L-aspartate semialdehyde sulfurtransferase ferredoxin